MSAPIPFSRLTSAVVNALRYLPRTAAGQCVITVEADRCEIDWRPGARFHHAMLLPLILLTAALDEGAAVARWRDVSFAKALSTAPAMDGGQKAILLALAGVEDNSEFDEEVVSWADHFDLAGSALTIDRADVAAHSPNGHYCIEPIEPLGQMPKILKQIPAVSQIAAVAVYALYNGTDAQSVFRGKRLAGMNPPAVDAFRIIRDAAGQPAHAHLLRMIAAYHGW